MNPRNRLIVAILFATTSSLASAAVPNLLPNSDFSINAGVSGWQGFLVVGGVGLVWDSDDANGDSGSGSMQFVIQTTAPTAGAQSTCFAVTPSAAYSYGGQSKVVSGTQVVTSFTCTASDTANCIGPYTSLPYPVMPAATSWTAPASTSGTLPSTTHAVFCVAETYNDILGNLGSARFDNLFFRSTDHVFANGFD